LTGRLVCAKQKTRFKYARVFFLDGVLAIYLGIDELKDTWKQEESAEPDAAIDEDVEKSKKEISALNDEIETLKEK